MINQTIQHTFSMRDQYIMAQALTVAIRELDKVPGAMKEVSNILDMRYLLESQFSNFAGIAEFLSSQADEVNNKHEVN
jgi:hypothetical protein